MAKKSIKLSALCMAIIMCLAMIAGCTGTPATTSPTNTPTTASTTGGGTEPTKTFKIGFIASLTGTFAANSLAMKEGVELFLEERNYQIGDYKIEVVYEDDEGSVETSLNKARKLVDMDKVDMIYGPLLANAGLAIGEYCDANKVLNLTPVVSAEDVTQRKSSPYIIRTGWSSALSNHPFGEWAYDQGYRKVATIAYDFAFGHEVVAGFHRTFQEKGGTIVQKLWPATGTQDFAPFLAQIPKDVDAVYANFSGADSLRFIKQYQEFGFKDIPLLGGATTVDEHVLPQMGDEAIGVVSALHWAPTLDTPECKAFVEAYNKKYGKGDPSYYCDATYSGLVFLETGLLKAGGIEDIEKFTNAIKETPMVAARGPMSLDEYNCVVENVYIRVVEKVDGKLQNTVIKTYENVSQFWTYGAEEFLKNPVYDRDFPALNK